MSSEASEPSPLKETTNLQNSNSLATAVPEGDNWIWSWSQTQLTWPSQDEEFDVATIECWNYEDEGTQKQEQTTGYGTERFGTEYVNSWLNDPYPLLNGQRPSSGFKIIVMPCGQESLYPSMTTEQAHSIASAFGLPNIQSHYSSISSGACGSFLQSDSSYTFVFRGTTDQAAITVMLRYNPQTNATCGVCYISLERISLQCFEKIPAQLMKCSHPLLLPLLTVELSFEIKVGQLIAVEKDLREIEDMTGYGFRIVQENEERVVDYRGLVRRLGYDQSQLCLAQSTISATQLSAEFIRKKLQYLNQNLPVEYRRKLESSSQMLEERVEFFLSNVEHVKLYAGLHERMQSQQTVLFNLIAQSDNLINVSLAKDSKEIAVASKQDSSAMKIIAVLTTFFLPGTFMATFFAMPLFNWSQPSISQVTSHHFWIYWAVTVPLTLVTIASVIAWALWHNRYVLLLQSRARDSVGKDSAKDEAQQGNESQESGTGIKSTGVAIPEYEVHNSHSLLHMFRHRYGHSDFATEP
ncbi:hypothetical protein F5884DRAFT_875544 [Xylogone sp. PMI_703]|nr:hypothetical protein F5884DRAFT_875544 [Xylogone sp. PMI_703]